MNWRARSGSRLATATSAEFPALRIAFQFLRAMRAVPRIPQRQSVADISCNLSCQRHHGLTSVPKEQQHRATRRASAERGFDLLSKTHSPDAQRLAPDVPRGTDGLGHVVEVHVVETVEAPRFH